MSDKTANIDLSRYAQWFNSADPTQRALRFGLAGAGLGAGAGLLSSQLSSNPEGNHPFSSAITGALAGGALGGGVGYSLPTLQGMVGGGSTPDPNEQYFQQLDQLGPDNVQHEMASRAGNSHLLRHSLAGAGGYAAGGAPNALARGARATEPFADVQFTTPGGRTTRNIERPDGNFRSVTREEAEKVQKMMSSAEMSRDALAHGQFSPGEQLGAASEAFLGQPSHLPPIDWSHPGEAASGVWQRAKAMPGRFWEAGPEVNEALNMGGRGALNNNAARQMFTRGLLRPSVAGIGGGVAGVLGSLALPHLARHMGLARGAQ
jgi:hypothetical protein